MQRSGRSLVCHVHAVATKASERSAVKCCSTGLSTTLL